MHYKKSLFLFHRDLRLYDNTALYAACAQSDKVIAAFIFTPEQVGEQNLYKSDHAIQFMVDSLKEVAQEITQRGGNFYFFVGHTSEVVTKLIQEHNIEAVFFNADYTPFARKRDGELEHIAATHKIGVHSYHDALINVPGEVLGVSGKPYQVFTPFWKAARVRPVTQVNKQILDKFYHDELKHAVTLQQALDMFEKYSVSTSVIQGGRTHGLVLMNALRDFKDYQETRDTPAIDTTLLSAHNKFGTISIREVYWHMRDVLGAAAEIGLIRQLYWRDFYYHIAYFWPHVFGHAFHQKYDAVTWHNDTQQFERWCQGMTGFPIVDAGMRQLNETGFMHNRVRMIAASFLTKDLLIDWRWGERYFAQKLVDYDPCVNNGNWQWAASTGCDPQPYFRIFNPWLQQKKFDPEAVYIKAWIPELAHVSAKVIHSWYAHKPVSEGYPMPIVDHERMRLRALAAYKKVA